MSIEFEFAPDELPTVRGVMLQAFTYLLTDDESSAEEIAAATEGAVLQVLAAGVMFQVIDPLANVPPTVVVGPELARHPKGHQLGYIVDTLLDVVKGISLPAIQAAHGGGLPAPCGECDECLAVKAEGEAATAGEASDDAVAAEEAAIRRARGDQS